MQKVQCCKCQDNKDLNLCEPINSHYTESEEPEERGRVGKLEYNYICEDCIKLEEQNGKSK